MKNNYCPFLQSAFYVLDTVLSNLISLNFSFNSGTINDSI